MNCEICQITNCGESCPESAAGQDVPSIELLSAKDDVIEAARCIRHWHDGSDGGMTVSGHHVRKLWEALAKLDKLQVDNDKVNRPADDVERLTEGLKDIHNRLTGKGGNPKWVVDHIENLLAGRKYWEWE